MNISTGCSSAPTSIPGIRRVPPRLEIRLCGPQSRRRSLYLCSQYTPCPPRAADSKMRDIAPSEFNFDDIKSFGGKVTDFNYRFLGRSKMLGNLAQEQIPFHRKSGDYLPLKEELGNRRGLCVLRSHPRIQITAILGKFSILISNYL